MPQFRKIVNRLFDDPSAVTAVEYGLIAGLIAVAIIVIVTQVGTDLTAVFQAVSTTLQSAGGT